MKKVEKPPVINLDEVVKWVKQRNKELKDFVAFTIKGEEYQEAQRDADAAYYEPLIQQARQEGQDVVLILLANDYPDEAVSLRQFLKSKYQEEK